MDAILGLGDRAQLVQSIKDSEGFSDTPYKDSQGFWTVGYGHKLGVHEPGPGTYPKEYLEILFTQDLFDAERQAEILARRKSTTELSAVRFTVLIEMCFILGYHGAAGFIQFFAALRAKDWTAACWELRHNSEGEISPWYREEHSRVDKICKRLETNSF